MENLINHSIEFFNFCDTALLLGLNGHHTAFLDCVMDIVSMRLVWAPLYIILLTMVWRRYGWRGAAVCLLTTIMAVTLVDQVCGSVLRGMVGRMRPSNPDNPLSAWIQIVDGYRGGKYGFPSCHAANTAVVAVYLSLWLRSKALFAALCAWCLLVSLEGLFRGALSQRHFSRHDHRGRRGVRFLQTFAPLQACVSGFPPQDNATEVVRPHLRPHLTSATLYL